uniref:Uncharacterized protein n=1 Tax=Rhizophora mucronata TaxID=61149 RepID=A0A2P2PVS5_RHIMU
MFQHPASRIIASQHADQRVSIGNVCDICRDNHFLEMPFYSLHSLRIVNRTFP